jgi:cell division protein FtsN
MIIAFGSCKPKQSAYRAAYEQAKEREATAPTQVTIVDNQAVDISPVSKPPASVEATRTERISAVQGEDPNRLKRFSVVVGSFRNKTNAYSLKDRMVSDGYSAVLAENEQGMLRVIVASYDDKAQAASSRDAIKAKYSPNFQDAWLLERTN